MMRKSITADRTLASKGPRRSRVRGLLLAAIVPAMLAGCVANRATEFTEVQGEPKTELMWVSMVHDVGFDVGAAKLSNAEAERLDRFFVDIGISANDNLVIDPGSFRGGIVEPRIDSVAGYLDDRLPSMPYRVGHLGWEESDESFRIIVGRYLVIPPKCPNLAASSIHDPNNLGSSNLGCATATNLALMVANPADLLHGQPYGATDGRLMSDAVSRYRSNNVENVEEVSSTAGGS